MLASGPRDEIYLVFGRTGSVDLLNMDGSLTHYAGNGTITTQPAVIGDGGPALDAQFSRISDVVVDSEGVMYLADEGQGVVRRVKPDGTIDTIIGLGPIRFLDAPDGTAASDVKLGPGPLGVTVDDAGNVFVSVRASGRVIRIDHATGAMTQVAPDTTFQSPTRLTFDNDGNLLVLIEDGKQVVSIAGVA